MKPLSVALLGVAAVAVLAPAAAARAKLPQDGISLVGPARHPSDLAGRGVLLETFPNPRGVPSYVAIRTERHRYDLQEDGAEGLYDLRLDPWELASKHADPAYARVKAILASRLERLRTCRGAAAA